MQKSSHVAEILTKVVGGLLFMFTLYMRNGNRVRVRVRVWVMARAWVGVRVRILFCSSIAQFLAILRIPHCTDAEGSSELSHHIV